MYKKLAYLIRTEGLRQALMRCARYPFRRLRDRRLAELQRNGTRSEIFTTIFEGNYWNSAQSVSGGGSTLEYTESLRNDLPRLFEQRSIRHVYDAPCGDFNWMRHVVNDTGIRYIGADIVRPLIEQLATKYQRDDIRFVVADIAADAFPQADLWICRDCLFHLSNSDILLALKNFAASQVPYVLTTTHIVPQGFMNSDIRPGGFRLIDLFSEPFCLSREVLFRVPDWVADSHYPPREMCLWSREQIADALPQLESALRRTAL